MIIGRVNSEGQPIVPIVIAGANGRERKLECLLATDFPGEMMLPKEEVAALGLPPTGTGVVGYPPGSPAEAPTHQADILWCGEKRTVTVCAYGHGPVIGMGMLRDSRVRIQFIEGGPISVESL